MLIRWKVDGFNGTVNLSEDHRAQFTPIPNSKYYIVCAVLKTVHLICGRDMIVNECFCFLLT